MREGGMWRCGGMSNTWQPMVEITAQVHDQKRDQDDFLKWRSRKGHERVAQLPRTWVFVNLDEFGGIILPKKTGWWLVEPTHLKKIFGRPKWVGIFPKFRGEH